MKVKEKKSKKGQVPLDPILFVVTVPSCQPTAKDRADAQERADDGRTFAGTDASIFSFVVFIAFFETAVRHHAVCCSLHLIGRQRCRARERIENPAKAKTVTEAKGQKGDAGAVFDLAPNVGSVSDRRAANGGAMTCVKKAKKTIRMRRAGGDWPPGGVGGSKGQIKRHAGAANSDAWREVSSAEPWLGGQRASRKAQSGARTAKG